MDEDVVRIPVSGSGRRACSMTCRWTRSAPPPEQLEEELERVRGAIRARTDYLSKADSLFKS